MNITKFKTKTHKFIIYFTLIHFFCPLKVGFKLFLIGWIFMVFEGVYVTTENQ